MGYIINRHSKLEKAILRLNLQSSTMVLKVWNTSYNHDTLVKLIYLIESEIETIKMELPKIK